MIAELKPYPNYQEQKDCWIGKVPVHWSLFPNRAIFAEIKDKDHPEEEMLSVTINRGIVRQKSVLEDSSKKDGSRKDKTSYKLVQRFDIAYNKMRAWQGAIGVSDFKGIISPAYVVMRLREHRDRPRYFHHLFRTPQFAKEAERWSYGITSDMWSLRPEHFKLIVVPQPPIEEQAAIVRFLDWANARLDRAIRAKRKVIALLNEQKQAIIHRAVTRGMEPNVRMKDSGIPWLGEIPEHWEVTALRRYWSVTDCKHLTVPFVEDGIPLASVVQVQPFSLDLSNAKKTKPKSFRLLIEGNRKPKRGDLIYCRNASVGACAIVETDEDFAMGQDVCLIRSKKQNQRFLNYVLHSPFMQNQLALLLVGSTFKRINVSDIKALTVLVPPMSEQESICQYLIPRLTEFDRSISQFESEIDLIREYRTRLIADVVTGKLDVREAAFRLPSEIPEPIETDDILESEDSDELVAEDFAE